MWAVHAVPQDDLKVCIWWAIGTRRIIGPVVFHETVNFERNATPILSPFLIKRNTPEKEIRGHIK
jgi:hypothetical protein